MRQRIQLFLFLLIIFVGGLAIWWNYATALMEKPKARKEKLAKDLANLEARILTKHFPARMPIVFAKAKLDFYVLHKYLINTVAISKDREWGARISGTTVKHPVSTKAEAFPVANKKKWQQLKATTEAHGAALLCVELCNQKTALANKYYRISDEDFMSASNRFKHTAKALQIDHFDASPLLKAFGEKGYRKIDHHPRFKPYLPMYEEIAARLQQSYGNFPSVLPHIQLLQTDTFLLEGSVTKTLGSCLSERTTQLYALPKQPIPFERYDDGEQVAPYIYKEDDKGDNFYFGGTERSSLIDTHRPNLPNILVYGDSMRRKMCCLLWMNANRLYSLDYRICTKADDLCQIIKEEKIDIVLVVMSGYGLVGAFNE